jgi:hypothetical protein
MKCLVHEVVGEHAITMDDGQAIFDKIKPELAAGRPVELDFAGVSVSASPFLNAAVGQLLRDLAPDELNRLLKVINLAPPTLDTLRRVIENSKRYYSSPSYREAVDRVMRSLAEDN